MDQSRSENGVPIAIARVPGQRQSPDGQPASRPPAGDQSADDQPGAGPPGGAAPATGAVPVPRRTDGFAVATLITGILGLIPVTAVLGPVALARVARSGARGGRLAVTGLVLAGAWLVAGGLAVAGLVAQRPPSAPASLPRIFAVHAGQCLDFAPNEMSGVHVVSCAAPHDAEVFGAFQVAGQHYPGSPAVRRAAGLGCASRLSGYLNPQLSPASLTESFVYPDAAAWAAGERTVVCTIRSATGQAHRIGAGAARLASGLATARRGQAWGRCGRSGHWDPVRGKRPPGGSAPSPDASEQRSILSVAPGTMDR